MSSKNRSVVRERMNTVSRKRLYKANGHWAVATTGTVALAAAGTLGAVSTVHADTAAPVESTQQVVSTPQEAVDTNVSTNTEVAPVVASANTTVNQAVQTAQPQVSVAGGNITSTAPQVVSQGDVDKVSQDADRQAMNVSAVGSTDGVMNAAIQSGLAATKSMGGSYVATSAKDASLMTPDQIQLFGQSEAAQLSAVGVGNAEQLSAANANGQLISNASGVMAPGKTMDVSKLTPDQIASMTSRAAAVLSATGSADSQLVSASNQYTSDINAVGGQLKRSSAINTADNMTVDQIMHLVESQVANVFATGSVDGRLAPLISEAQSVASQAGITLKSGQSIDVSSMTSEQIQSLGQSLVDNYKNVAGHDELINSAVPAVSGVVASAGGKMTPGSVIDATNWTPEQIVSETKQQSEMISATGSADADVKSNVDSATDDITKAGGTITRGADINAASMTASDIIADGEKQAANVAATVSGDAIINSTLTHAWSQTVTRGSAIDVSSMTLEQIASLTASEADAIGETQNANEQLSEAVSRTSQSIHEIGGKTIIVLVKQTEGIGI